MRRALLPLLRCPACRAPLQARALVGDDPIDTGVLTCRAGHWYQVRGGIPRLLLPPYRRQDAAFLTSHGLDLSPFPGTGEDGDTQQQVQDSFSAKWAKFPRFGFDRPGIRDFFDAWFRRKLGLPDPEDFARFLRGKRRVLDAGTGLGAKVETVGRLHPEAVVVGVDIADGVDDAVRNTGHLPGAHIVQADLRDLPFAPETFDLIVSDGVLHHTPDTRASFRALLPFLAPGGHIAIHVYRKLGPIREFCDDHIRARTTGMSPAECWEAVKAFTDVGRTLSELKVEIEVPKDIPVLEIPAGRYDLQRFLYYHVFKCFWNPEFGYEESNLVNFDWYHPADAHRHTEAEVVGWFAEAGLEEIVALQPNESGVAVRGRKPVRPA